MSKLRVLDFRSYHAINEEDSSPNSSNAVKTILDLFFQAYAALYGKAEDYKDSDVNKDLLAIKNSPMDKKGDAMLSALSKIAPEVSTAYLEASDKMIDAAKEIKNAYDTLITTEEGKKQMESIDAAITSKLSEFAKALRATNEPLEYTNEDEDYSESFQLFEKNIYPKARKSVLDTIDPVIATLMSTINGPSSEAVKAKAQNSLNILNKLKAELETDGVWAKMSKKERKARIQEIPLEIQKIQQEIMQYQAKAIETQGFDQKVSAIIKKVSDLITAAIQILGKAEAKEVGEIADEEGGGTELKDDEEGGADDEDIETEDTKGSAADLSSFKTIKFGTEGDEVMDIQVKINKILPKASRVQENGKFDSNTQKAIKKVVAVFSHTAPPLLSKVDGKTITPGLQAFLENRTSNKSYIKDEIRYRA